MKIKEVNTATGEEILRDATKEELTQFKADEAKWLAEQAAAESRAQTLAEVKASAKAKLAALGLTADEIAAFHG